MISPTVKEIPPDKFYGGVSARQARIEAIIKNEPNQVRDSGDVPKFMKQLLGPSRTWKVFKWQQDAIECCLQRRNGLMCFAFEDVNGRRMFLVAHPKVFWSFNRNRFFKRCNTYEIIIEHSACKLYLDIEFDREHNGNSNQERMMATLLKILNVNLKSTYGIECMNEDILDMDSSNAVKFSRHVVYEMRNVAFQDNYAVGNFIRHICGELREAYETNLTGDNSKLSELSAKYQITADEILELFVVGSDGEKVKLFVDEGVYTKNRHFRVLGSSKQSKKVPFVLSETNRYRPRTDSSSSDESRECCLFLDSLVTCFTWDVTRVLEFDGDLGRRERRGERGPGTADRLGRTTGDTSRAQYPELDTFILRLIAPNGRIRRRTFFADKSTLLYDVQGFRYCDNIRREHKSNNIKYVVDLQALAYYQKCYDPDCRDFRSEKRPLPAEIRFLFDEGGDAVFESIETAGCEFSGTMDDLDFAKFLESHETSIDFDDIGVREEDLGNVVDCAEALLDVKW